ncbi:MAG: hypothetical protein QM831_36725 [Kofleriaceae bacterium]
MTKGRVSFPYIVKAYAPDGRDYGEMTLGQFDVSIAANGKVTARVSLGVDELPPELTRGHSDYTPDYVRQMKFAGEFTSKGKAKYGHIYSGHDCDMYFETVSTFKPGHSVSFKKPMGEKCSESYDCESDYCDSANHCAKKD